MYKSFLLSRVHVLMYYTLYNYMYMYIHLRSIGDDNVGGINGVNECPSQVDCTPARVSHLLLCPVSVCECVCVCVHVGGKGRTRNNMWVGLKIITVNSYINVVLQCTRYIHISVPHIKQTEPSIIDTRLYPTNPAISWGYRFLAYRTMNHVFPSCCSQGYSYTCSRRGVHWRARTISSSSP